MNRRDLMRMAGVSAFAFALRDNTGIAAEMGKGRKPSVAPGAMPPFPFIENDQFVEAPTVKKKWVREGAAAPAFEAVDVLPTLARKTVEYDESAGEQRAVGQHHCDICQRQRMFTGGRHF